MPPAPTSLRTSWAVACLASAVTVGRHVPGQQVANARQALTIREALDAYTIEGARPRGKL